MRSYINVNFLAKVGTVLVTSFQISVSAIFFFPCVLLTGLELIFPRNNPNLATVKLLSCLLTLTSLCQSHLLKPDHFICKLALATEGEALENTHEGCDCGMLAGWIAMKFCADIQGSLNVQSTRGLRPVTPAGQVFTYRWNISTSVFRLIRVYHKEIHVPGASSNFN